MPVIGLTTSRLKNERGDPMISVMETYVKAVVQAGGAPLLIPLGLPEQTLKELANRLDAILFTGGGDIHPERYGSRPDPRAASVDEDRDRVEMQLFREARDKGMPFLGICRGLQVINVACGGSLYLDIAGQHEAALEHRYYPNWPRDKLAHSVEVTEESLLARIVGQTQLAVNSLHHQAIDRLAPGLKATASAPDGIIEAVELSSTPFGLAVQWHPEWLTDQAPMRALFRALVEAANEKTGK